MTKVRALEKEVAKPSRAELNAFRKWFQEYDADLWDKQIEQDAKAGRLDKLFKKALVDHKAGKSTEP